MLRESLFRLLAMVGWGRCRCCRRIRRIFRHGKCYTCYQGELDVLADHKLITEDARDFWRRAGRR